MSLSATFRQRSVIRDWFWSVDRISVTAIGLLIFIGLLLSMAASPGASVASDPFFYLKRHVVFAGAAMFSLFAVSLFSPQNARRLAMLALVCSLLLMIYILLFGHTAGGGQRWIRISSFTLQPSEFVKPGLVVTFAWLFAKSKKSNFPGTLLAIGVYGITAVLLLLQPDFGQTVLITICFAAVFFMSGMSWVWIVSFGVAGIVGMFSAYSFMPHVASRVDRFLNPEGSDTYQVDMAMAAIQRGGFFGRGPGEGRIKNSIPDAHTDFIFSVAAEEYGMLLSVTIIGLYAVIIARSMMRALRLTDITSQLAAAGLTTLFGLQAFINIGVNLQVIPAKGMTLPFISYGGSSMLATGLTVGLLLAFTRSRPGLIE
ncbi:Cell division protein FtsW [hydrothermal vent metagenome]|uniref:peptidoglycan glycosyltransferase n=1 Tax=hydrothermal vent metagenome TaxID=652676 RepID=A0A3B0SM58_9ZZZZ